MEQPVAIIMGGSGDIGGAVVKLLEAGGYFVVPTYHNAHITHIHATECDVRDAMRMAQLVHDVCFWRGRIDVLVNCVGLLQQKDYRDITSFDWSDVIKINLYGTFLCLQTVMPVMQEQKSGNIVTIASVGGETGGTLAPHYAAAKAGVVALTKSFARIGAPNVRVNCVSPGLIEGKMSQQEIDSPEGQDKIARNILLKRPGTVDEVAQAVMFCISNEYMTGQVIGVNGGQYMG
jgi:3-oxoacyl-[acyl-carrier protein] reductase